MNQNTISGDMIGIALRQLGASSIREITSIMHIVNFDLSDGTEVSYVFNITKNSRYFLQRMRPYPLPQGKFADVQQIIDFISEDIAAFRNAHKSSNFKRFIQVAEQVSRLTASMEDLFLNLNVDGAELEQFHQQLDELEGTIQLLNEHAKPL